MKLIGIEDFIMIHAVVKYSDKGLSLKGKSSTSFTTLSTSKDNNDSFFVFGSYLYI